MFIYSLRRPLILLCSLIMITAFLPHGSSLNFNLVNISSRNLNIDITVEKDSYISFRGIEVTSDEYNVNRKQKAGRAMYIEHLHLWDKSSGNLTDFNTHFLFVIDSEQYPLFGDGVTFFLIPPGDSNITEGVAMGLPIDPNTFKPTSPFVAVEFDTYNNKGADPENIEAHVGIDVNSLVSSSTVAWENAIYYGLENEAWISYDSSLKNLSVVFTGYRNTTKIIQGLHLIVDLRDYLPEWVRIGFSASTGALLQRNNVRSWQFNSSLHIDEKTSSENQGGRNKMGMTIGSTIAVSYLFVVVGLVIQ